jgi:signal transduction histidine kinase
MSFASRNLMAVPKLVWIALALGVYLVSAAAIALWRLHQETLESQTRELGLLSLALADELDRGLRGVDEGLQALSVELLEGHLQPTGTAATRSLGTRADLMPLVRTLWLVDGDGRLLSASNPSPVPEFSSFLPALDRVGKSVTAVSRPLLDPIGNEPVVALATRFAGFGGRAGGWIMAGIPANALLGAFSAATPAADARMAVFRDDGVLLAGTIVTAPTLDEASVARRLSSPHTAVVRAFLNGSERLVGLHPLPRYGLEVVLTRDVETLLVGWKESAQLTSVGIVLLLAVMAVSLYLVQRANRRHAEAERALETQRTRATILESLGTLAGGVAHDFNNVLAGIIGYGEMSQDEALAGSDQARHLDKMMQAALRGKSLVERILAFSRGGAHASAVFELQPVVDEVLTLLAGSLRPGVIFERELDARGARLRGDATQAFEAVMNLCTNAMQAMPNGGMLSVRLKRLHVAAPRVLSHSRLAAGDYLVLTVSDQGTGIHPDVMEHLFEPFFTTRGAHFGTGLGLAVVHGVVAEFGGAIDVQSTPEHGASFILYLPECTEALGPPKSSPEATPLGAGQNLLVLDDDPALVALSEELLKALGYNTVGYSDPAAALEALRADPQRFAAVITDEVMPGLSGTQLTEALRVHAPQLPVLLVSGYGGELLASRAAAAGVTRVLGKPLQRADLARVLAELLR